MGILTFLFGKKGEAAKPKSNARQPLPSIKKETVDWRTSKAHLLLLSRFLYGQKAKDAVPLHWEAVLGEPPQKAVDHFISEGWLVPASLSVKLDRTFNTTEIRKLLKEHGLPVSGRKEQCIERLIRGAPEEMTVKVANLNIIECSPEARAIANRFVAERNAEKEAAEAKSLEQLCRGDFRSASLTVALFEAKQVFPRGLGIDWTKPNTDGDVQLLKAIFESRPKILADLAAVEWNPLHVGAAMMHLWGTNRASKWLPVDFVGISKFDNDTATRMVLFHARHRAAVESWRRYGLGIKEVELLCSEDSCPACKKLAEKRFAIDKIPELPYKKCAHPMGCRCNALPVI